MADTILPEQAGERTASPAKTTEDLKTFRSGDSASTTLTAQDIARLEGLTKDQALAQVCEELAALLVTYHNLGGEITALTLPEGKSIMARRHVIVLPAKKDEYGAYALDVP